MRWIIQNPPLCKCHCLCSAFHEMFIFAMLCDISLIMDDSLKIKCLECINQLWFLSQSQNTHCFQWKMAWQHIVVRILVALWLRPDSLIVIFFSLQDWWKPIPSHSSMSFFFSWAWSERPPIFQGGQQRGADARNAKKVGEENAALCTPFAPKRSC